MTDFKAVQQKWQKKWADAKAFKTNDKGKNKCYVLEMFPYPSASGLHIGHAFNYIIGDVYARFKRMNGFNVLYPMGYDALGLPAENAAIKANAHPRKFTESAIANFIKQQKELGLSYDWERMVKTCDYEYYQWNQYFFLKFMEKGLVYRKKAPVNWCPKCNTVLANEQVHSGKCWRHEDTEVTIKHLEQWFVKTTDYAEELLKDIDGLQWPERIKTMQKNWIGKSYGTTIKFKINNEEWPIFTTRPDTIYGVTFMVISAQHPRLMELVTPEQRGEVEAFLKKIKSTSEKDAEELEKEGAFTGSYAINPVTNSKIPVYTGNFVVADYGAGMVMAVPSHDQRDFEFAKKYGIKIIAVIQPDDYELNAEKMSRAYTSEGTLTNSGEFNGLSNLTAIEEITKHLEKKKLGSKTIQYKLRDWLISRQRYWGTPIPIVYCDKCRIVPVPEKELPVKLPDDVKFGEGNPLATSKEFVNTLCPKCKGRARRETDTMDTFFDSSWYFLRYCDNKNGKKPFDTEKVKYWMPVDQYIGGAEHACMHLIYARFFTKALRDMGMVNVDEPFTRLFNQGMLHGSDGRVMSKSGGNGVLPETVSDKYGIDTARFFLLSIASPDKDLVWSDAGIEGSMRFINKVMNYFETAKTGKSQKKTESKLNQAIKQITKNIENFEYNLAIIKIRELFESLNEKESKETIETFLKLMHPFCPHITEELWERTGRKPFLTLSDWPKANEKKIDEKIDAMDELAEKTAADISKVIELAGKKPKEITLIVSPQWKYEFFTSLKKEMNETRDTGQLIRKTMIKEHAKEISALAVKIIQDPSKMPETILSQKQESEALKEAQKAMAEKFGAEIKIEKAETSKEQKSVQAIPGKPAITISFSS
jgi:leucyl-tRNA synthetase